MHFEQYYDKIENFLKNHYFVKNKSKYKKVNKSLIFRKLLDINT